MIEFISNNLGVVIALVGLLIIAITYLLTMRIEEDKDFLKFFMSFGLLVYIVGTCIYSFGFWIGI